MQPLSWDLAPGGTRICNLRIRSEARRVWLVMPQGIDAGRVGFAVRLVASRPAPSQRPDCRGDCQPHDRPRPTSDRTTGLHIGRAPSSGRCDAAGAVDSGQQQLGGDRLNPVASMLRVALDRVLDLSGQPLTGRGKRGEHPADLGTADAELGLGLGLQVLIGQLGGVVAQQRQDFNSSRGELGDEPVGQGGGHPARGRTGRVGF
jgi:hypothetical protein